MAWLRYALVLVLLSCGHAASAMAGCGSKARIVLDVGHAPPKPGMKCPVGSQVSCPWGATSARGKSEFEFNLALTKVLKSALQEAGFTSVHLLTVETPPPRGLFERGRKAKSLGADIYLSIHHDSIKNEFLHTWEHAGQPRHYRDDVKGFSLHVANAALRSADSLKYAKLLADGLVAKGFVPNPVHERGNPMGAGVTAIDLQRGLYEREGIYVLSSARHMLAVLLEAGVIVNRAEEEMLSSDEFRRRFSTVVAETLKSYCKDAAKPR